MKTLIRTTLAALLLTGTSGLLTSAQAQVNVNINIPSWGVAAPAGTQYYYVPEYGGYYDLRAQQYIVQRNGQWARVASLNGYNPSGFHPVVIDYVGAQPWVGYTTHKTKYGHPHGMPPGQAKKMRGAYVAPGGGQVIVVDGPGGKGKGHGNGHGNGKGKGKH
ncbi:hypothetical protein EJV47_03250 [Hymenobacter gummosus]|uniref:WG repeat-containing protein n=1 Tax=Hymenobacter gummosus TaxID=1776032 RepID=A0A3S0JE63_9BACT|nr:hypothetical protein [Hymenobacter gummosus]RTQ53764.1 hypothetical protein EJV47_03250 [Hymenobacter gummosus]